MQISYSDGIYTIKTPNFSVLINEDHQILNAQVINSFFNTKIPTDKFFSLEQLLKHKDISKYTKFRDFLIECLTLIRNDGFNAKMNQSKINQLKEEKSKQVEPVEPKIITKEKTVLVPIPTPNMDYYRTLAIIKKINIFIIILFIIWLVLIVIEIYNIELRSKGVTIKR